MKMRFFTIPLLALAVSLFAETTRKPVGLSTTFKFYNDSKEITAAEVNGEVKEYFDSVKVKGVFLYKKGQLDGLQKEFFDNGQLAAEYQMNNGMRDGSGKEFYEDGKVAFERKLVNGTGTGTEFFPNGQIKRVRKYENGKQINASKLNFDFDGKKFDRDEMGAFAEAQQYAVDGQFYHAINGYESFIKQFPKSTHAPKARFLIAFTYNNQLSDTESAKKQYKTFIESYPNHDLRQSAEYELNNMGKSLEDLPEFKN